MDRPLWWPSIVWCRASPEAADSDALREPDSSSCGERTDSR